VKVKGVLIEESPKKKTKSADSGSIENLDKSIESSHSSKNN
jgi:hypothetical protein